MRYGDTWGNDHVWTEFRHCVNHGINVRIGGNIIIYQKLSTRSDCACIVRH